VRRFLIGPGCAAQSAADVDTCTQVAGVSSPRENSPGYMVLLSFPPIWMPTRTCSVQAYIGGLPEAVSQFLRGFTASARWPPAFCAALPGAGHALWRC
jgi:hypothetical protein